MLPVRRSLWVPMWVVVLALSGGTSAWIGWVVAAVATLHLTWLFEVQEEIFRVGTSDKPLTLAELLVIVPSGGLPLYQASEAGVQPVTGWFTCSLNGAPALVLETSTEKEIDPNGK